LGYFSQLLAVVLFLFFLRTIPKVVLMWILYPFFHRVAEGGFSIPTPPTSCMDWLTAGPL